MAKSSKIASLLKENYKANLYSILRDIPTTPETFELVARFCHGYDVHMSAENVIPLICVAEYLGMTESHSKNNLLDQSLLFFQEKILPNWNETIKAFRTTETILQKAIELGIIDACLHSIVTNALSNPRILGDPIKRACFDDSEDDHDENYRPNPRRRLFELDWQYEDLTTLSLKLYEPVICEMSKLGVPLEYVVSSLCKYAEKWVLSEEGKIPISYQREIIEAVERLLPHDERGLVPCTSLLKMLRCCIYLEANSKCRNGFEMRIGEQLDQATVEDLLIPSQGYAKEVQYDVECVKRMLKHFYGNIKSSNLSKFNAVAELMEDFLVEVASDIDLKLQTFITIADMSCATSLGTHRSSDGIYRGIDIYFEKHKHLTESEKQQVCQVLDIQKMSPEACEHAAKNERLPLRVVVQVLFFSQLHLRDTMNMKEVQSSDDRSRKEEDAGIEEMDRMSKKVMELETECCKMRKDIEKGCNLKVKKEKVSLWKEVKRKFGCSNSFTDCNCQGKKKKKVDPKYMVEN